MGYKDRTKKLNFPDLTGDPADPVWLVIRNPRTMPPDDIVPEDVTPGEMPESDQIMAAGRKVFAKLIVAWRVYDASQQPQYDPVTGEVIPGTDTQELLPPPSTAGVDPELIRKLPTEIIMAIAKELEAARAPS